jgi:tRNA(fMet)-specific endonuclease VapC
MAIILDADVIIRGEKGSFDLSKWLTGNSDEDFEVAAITVAELWHGVERATRIHRSRREQYLRTILAPLPIIPYTEQTAYEHAKLWAELETSGKMIGAHDIIVAATARGRGSQIATFNQRHFKFVTGINIIVPS